MPTQPNPNATSSTFQVGTYTSLSDTFTSVFDLNDGVTTNIMWNTLRMPQPEKAFVRSFNLRAPGERVTRFQYKNRHIQVSVSLRGAAVQAILNTCHNLIAAIENPPYRLRISQPNATNYTYASVVAVTHNIPADPQTLLAKALPNVQIDFECLPGLLGDRVTLSNLVTNPGFEAPSGPGVTAFKDAFNTTNAYTLVGGAAPSVAANVMTIPSGATVQFGSAAWGAINQWVIRFQFATSLQGFFHLHFTDANNNLRVEVANGTNGFKLVHMIAGTPHILAQSTITLTAGTFYWLQSVQFPAQAGNAPYVQATIFNDSAGAVGSQVATQGPTATFDGATALSGKPALAAAGAALLVGGNFASVHYLQTFGPGGWMFSGQVGAAANVCSGAWEQNSGNTYPNGPVTSYSALRTDIGPAGTTEATWFVFGGGGSPVGSYAIPIAAAGNTIGWSISAKQTGLAVSTTCEIYFAEFDVNGVFLRNGGFTSLKGATWATYSGTYTTGANCAYLSPNLHLIDSTPGASANATCWWDNLQVWNQTTTGQTSMPYCELRFPQSPAQLVVSGLVGDLPTPAFVAAGAYLANWPLGGTISLLLGRRASAHPAAQLIRYPLQPFIASANIFLDSASYGGYYTRSAAAQTSAQANMIYIGATPAAALGAYHLMERALSSQTVGNLGNVSSQLAAFEGFAGIFSNQVNFFNAFVASQFSAQNTWTLVDHGTLFVPLFTAGALTDVSQQYQSCYGNWKDSTGGGSQWSFGVPWLLPIDSDVLGATLINPSTGGGPITTAWLWTYSDAIGQNSSAGGGFAWGFSIETAPLPAPAHSVGGPGSQQSGQISVNPNATPYLTLDPTAGAGSGAAGVNQAVGSLVDQNGALLPFHCEIQYTPLYLYPR